MGLKKSPAGAGMTTGAMLLCVVCYFVVDRPVARLAADHVVGHAARRLVFQAMAAPSLLALPFGLVYLSALVLKAGQSDKTWPAQWLLTRISVAIIAATAGKDLLKWVFGRPWPATWLDYGIYAFSPFNTNLLYGSFPSGHTAYISAPLLVVAHERPGWRLPCYGVIGLVMLGLVGGGYHFPGDTVAGLLTGYLAAQGTLAMMRA